MPGLHKPKSMPLAVFVSNANADNDHDHDGYGSSLFVMERIPKPELGSNSDHCSSPEITSYAVLGGGSHICLSVNGVGTYCLETASHTRSEVGKWTPPFHGRIDYVPEFNLWFGLSAEARHLAASDLSAMDSQPQLVGPWKELNLPEEWRECKDPQLVNLGSGRFCIARFFRSNSDFGDGPIAVITGVKVVPHVGDANANANKGSNGKVQLQMIPHISKCYTSNATTIDAVF
uniref:Uncharacterized protein n=1 Tax=Oryza glumipatula TaxID=40148 RepID=A0A0D9Y834_9ORYZ